MQYEVSEKIRTSRSQADIIQALETQFRNVSSNVQKTGQRLVVKKIARTVGSINRSDVTTVSLRQTEDGWLAVAHVNYSPSAVMFILVVLTIFTAIGWAIPIIFYMMQKEMVRSAIHNCLHNVKNEFDQPAHSSMVASQSYLRELEQLSALKQQGMISDSEFEAKRKHLLVI